jgi:arabinose-5-phosphate isomerase
MSQLLFSNILVSILKKNIDLDNYKMNHPLGQIGKNLLKIKDVLITEYPKIILKDNIGLNKILLEMTKYKIGCCFFINENNKLIGILTDGDIRRILIDNPKINIICEENINKDYYYETDMERSVCDCNKTNSFIPIIVDNKLISIVKY